MDIQSAELFETFVLFPVIIQGSIKPVRPAGTADCGIPKSLYDDQIRGLECLVDPWIEPFNVPTAKGDRVDLFINTSPVPVDGKTIAPGDENQRIRLYVPKGRLHDGFNQIYYRVTRASGNGSEDSRKLRVLYHRWAPGEPAPDSIRLQISDEVVTNGVGLELATRGVEFGLDYSNRRPYDFISLSLGARGLVERELTPEEAEPGQSVTQTLYIDTFRKNPDNVRTPILYSATDQLGNFNQSVTRYIDVHINRTTLAKAILREIPTDNNDDPAIVDLDKLNGSPLSALIHLVATIWKAGDSIKLAFTAELNGGVVATHEETHTVTQVPSQFLWSIPNNKIIANSTVKVIYQQIRGTVVATSEPATAQVVGVGVPPVPELIVDTSLLSLKGENFTFRLFHVEYTGDDAINTAASRAASGGVPLYTYGSLDRTIASVDSKGVVRSEGNGRTTISVRDAAGQQKSFDVETANVTHIERTPRTTLTAARAYISKVGGFMIADSLTNRWVQIASRRISAHTIPIGIMVQPPYQGQITIAKNAEGEEPRFGVATLHEDGTTFVDYWTNKPSS